MNQLRALTYVIMGILCMLGTSESLAAKEKKVSKELSPMANPERMVGYRSYSIIDGKKWITYTLKARGAGMESWVGGDGCSWTKTGRFAPSSAWKNCGGRPGTQQVKFKGGDIWPLKVGNKFQYTYTGRNDQGDAWSGSRTCKVKKQVRIKTVSGEYDTYKVVCTDKWNVRTWWMSPVLKASVRFKRERKKGATTVYETTKIEWP